MSSVMIVLYLAAQVASSSIAYLETRVASPIPQIAPGNYDYWLKGPSPKDLSAIAHRAGRDGEAQLRCKVNADGRLKDCKVSELLGGQIFSSAAIKLSKSFLMKPDISAGLYDLSSVVIIQIPFCSGVCDQPEWRQ